jgi:hypothetical protein
MQDVVDGTVVLEEDSNGIATFGITFPATPVLGSNKTLYDYEQRVFTPVVTCTTPGDLSLAGGASIGYATKIGDLVTFQWDYSQNINYNTASGLIILQGLPWAPQENAFGAVGVYNNYTKTNFPVLGWQMAQPSSDMYLQCSGVGQININADITDFQTGGTLVLRFQGSYRTNE